MQVTFDPAGDIPGEILCGSCRRPWTDPVELRPCGHTFCRCCIGSTPRNCPGCREAITGRSQPSKVVVSAARSVTVECARCNWQGTHGESARHTCPQSADTAAAEPWVDYEALAAGARSAAATIGAVAVVAAGVAATGVVSGASLAAKGIVAGADAAGLFGASRSPASTPPPASSANEDKSRPAAPSVASAAWAMQCVASAALDLGRKVPSDYAVVPNPCLTGNASPLIAAFEAGVRQAGLAGPDAPVSLAPADTVMAFHGTGAPLPILCRGFDPSKRSGQVWGPGEYFAEDWKTAKSYGGSSAVVVALILRAKAKPVNKSWYVVDNPIDRGATYCLPLLAILLNGDSALPPCPTCGASNPAAPTVEWEADDKSTWVAMKPADAAAVVAAKARGRTDAVLTVGGWSYDFDWSRMVQINSKTRKERRIRIRDV